MQAHRILPPNRSPLEAAFVNAFDELINFDLNIFTDLRDPDKTPSLTVNTLANDKGIRHWDSDASEAVKRKQIKAAWPSRALAGSKQGIHDCIIGNGFIPSYTVPAPFTISVTAFHEGFSPLTDKSVSVLQKQLREAVNGRDKLELAIGTAVNHVKAVAMAIQIETEITITQ